MKKALPTSKNFLGLEAEHSSYAASKIVIVQAPYEKTVSYGKGTAKAPGAIINASHYVEFFDDEFFVELCFKEGIATLPPVDFGKHSGKKALAILEKAVADEITAGKFVVTLGGEHSISTAPIAAHYKRYPKMSILHFDAHSDLRDSYSGTCYSHASFMSRVADEVKFPMERVVQVGIRAQCIEEFEFIKQHGIKTFYATNIRRSKHGAKWQESVINALPSEEIYITFDVDYFDPSIMPTTGTPEPDGFFWNETMEIFRMLNKAGKKIIGFDVVELVPEKSQQHATYLVAKLVYRMLNFAYA
ncbi:MAG TPA: agmatinase [Candidatus Kapabacteria bacterium]|nr:agmatinase [Candidatus Kapabacteria bacterium]